MEIIWPRSSQKSDAHVVWDPCSPATSFVFILHCWWSLSIKSGLGNLLVARNVIQLFQEEEGNAVVSWMKMMQTIGPILHIRKKAEFPILPQCSIGNCNFLSLASFRIIMHLHLLRILPENSRKLNHHYLVIALPILIGQVRNGQPLTNYRP